jgi:hypothetical protein
MDTIFALSASVMALAWYWGRMVDRAMRED